MTLTECYAGLTSLDLSDADASQTVVQGCMAALLDPALWGWLVGLTVVFGAIGALIGLAKGRWVSGLVWGLVLGPIGWIVVALSKSSLVECPECGRRNVPAAKACRHCGVNLRAAAQRSVRATFKRNDSGRGW